MKSGIEIVLDECIRQKEVKGYTPEHDDTHVNGELAEAAAAYAVPNGHHFRHKDISWKVDEISRFDIWPFEESAFKPTPENRKKELAKAGAFIVAEIERLQRLELKNNKNVPEDKN